MRQYQGDRRVPGPVVVFSSPTVSNPVRRPPGPGTKERKVRAQGALAGLNGLLGAAAGVYEDAKFARDLVNAFYKALPNNKGAKDPVSQLRELYARWSEVDVNAAVLGVLKEVAKEHAGAYIDRARRVASNNLGLNMHITTPVGSSPYVR